MVETDAEFADDWEILRGDIDRSEFESLKRLRSMLLATDYHPACQKGPKCANPYVLLRQLRSCLTVESAAKFFGKSHLEWCMKVDLDVGIAEWREEYEAGRTRRAKVMREFFPISQAFPDKYGVPVLYVSIGVIDTEGLLREVGPRAFLMHWMMLQEQSSELLTQACRRLRKAVPGQLWVFDFDNTPEVPDWTYRMTVGFKPLVEILTQMKYPTIQRKVMSLRTGPVLTGAWKTVIRPMLTQVISGKGLSSIKVYDSFSSWKDKLQAEVNQQDLPAYLLSDSPEVLKDAPPRGGIIPEASEAEKAAAAEADESAAMRPTWLPKAATDEDTATARTHSNDSGFASAEEDVGAAGVDSKRDEDVPKDASDVCEATDGGLATGATNGKDAVSEVGLGGVGGDDSKVARAEEENGDGGI